MNTEDTQDTSPVQSASKPESKQIAITFDGLLRILDDVQQHPETVTGFAFKIASLFVEAAQAEIDELFWARELKEDMYTRHEEEEGEDTPYSDLNFGHLAEIVSSVAKRLQREESRPEAISTFLEEMIANNKAMEFVDALERVLPMLVEELQLEIKERRQRRQQRSETGEIKQLKLEKAFDDGDDFIITVEAIVADRRAQESDYLGIKELLRSTLARMDKALKRQQIEEKVLEEFQPEIDKEALRRLGAETFEQLTERYLPEIRDEDARSELALDQIETF
jgi:hypothetical protein